MSVSLKHVALLSVMVLSIAGARNDRPAILQPQPEFNYQWQQPEPTETVRISTGVKLHAVSDSGNKWADEASLAILFRKITEHYKHTPTHVIIEAGSYGLAAPLRPERDHTISGEDDTLLFAEKEMGAMILVSEKKSVTIRNLRLMGKGRAGNETSGVVVKEGSTYTQIINVTIRNTGGHGILVHGSDAHHTIVKNCSVTDVGQSGISFANSSEASVRDNHVTRTTNHGIIFANGGSRNEVIGNTVRDASIYMGEFGHGIAFDSHGWIHKGQDNLIKNNRVIRSRCGGIEIADGQDRMTIIDNVIEHSGREDSRRPDQYGIYFGGALCQSYQCLIQGNTVRGSYHAGIRIDAPHPERAKPILDANDKVVNPLGPTENVQIIDNNISDSAHYGIQIGFVQNVHITENEVRDSGKADIWIGGKKGKLTTYPATQVRLRNNSLHSKIPYEATNNAVVERQ